MNYVQMWLFMTNQPEPLRQTSLLMVLACGIGHGDSLLLGLHAHQQECTGDWGGKVGTLRTLLEEGHSLSDSIAMISEFLPAQTVSAIGTAEQTGTLHAVLMDEAQRISQSLQSSAGNSVNLESLALMTAATSTILICIVTFLMVFIIPKFKEIFIGFGVELPASTMKLIDISDGLLSFGVLLFLPVCAAVTFLFWTLYRSSRKRMIHGHHSFVEHWPRYWVPGLLRQLSLAASTARPLSVAVQNVTKSVPAGRSAECFDDLGHRISRGTDPVEALCALKLLRPREAAFLQASLKTRHLDWGLRHLAVTIEENRRRWVNRIPAILVPAVLLILGLLVLFVVTSLFMPLITLLEQLCGATESSPLIRISARFSDLRYLATCVLFLTV